MDRPTVTDVEQAVGDWRTLDHGVSGWFAAPSLSAGAELVQRIVALVADGAVPDVDLRPGGVRVRIGAGASAELTADELRLAQAISAAAGDLGLTGDPSILQSLGIVIETADPAAVQPFWQTALGFEKTAEALLGDPTRRDPVVRFAPLDQPRPLRDRFHVDVVRAEETVSATKTALGVQTHGVYGLTIADADGNEIDLVPGGELADGPATSDWRALFSALTFYPVTSPQQAGALASTVARLADDSGTPIMIDLRPDGVTIDSGKDQWEDDVRPGAAPFADLAARIQTAAHELGHTAEPAPLRFVQLAIDAADITTVRAFWTAVLGYQHDPRTHVTDIVDPHRLNPVIMFQDLDASDLARRGQRNRIHLELVVPHDQLGPRIDRALAAGGRSLDGDDPHRHPVADPEGNEIHFVIRS